MPPTTEQLVFRYDSVPLEVALATGRQDVRRRRRRYAYLANCERGREGAAAEAGRWGGGMDCSIGFSRSRSHFQSTTFGSPAVVFLPPLLLRRCRCPQYVHTSNGKISLLTCYSSPLPASRPTAGDVKTATRLHSVRFPFFVTSPLPILQQIKDK